MNTTFNRLVATSPVIAFNSMWKNGTGYLDGASSGDHAPNVDVGQVVTTTDDFGRSVIIIGTTSGKNAVVFQRHTGNKPDGVLVGNIPSDMTKILNEKGIEVYSSILEKGMAGLCDFIAHTFARTSTDWADKARHLSPWSVV